MTQNLVNFAVNALFVRIFSSIEPKLSDENIGNDKQSIYFFFIYSQQNSRFMIFNSNIWWKIKLFIFCQTMSYCISNEKLKKFAALEVYFFCQLKSS